MTNFTLNQNAGNDTINVADIAARIEELEAIVEDSDATDSDDDASELAALLHFMTEIVGMGDDEEWRGDWYPATLIEDEYMDEYLDELVQDCYPDQYKNLPSFMTITLDYVALKSDYTSAELDGFTYWMR